MGLRGPKPTTINWDQFDKLVAAQCTQIEIAAFFDVSVNTLERMCIRDRGEKLGDIWHKRQFMGKVRLRKLHFKIAESGGPGAATMAIYLDKKIFPEENPNLWEARAAAGNNNTFTPPEAKRTFVEFCEEAGYPMPFDKQCEMREFGFEESAPRMLLGSRGYGKTDYLTVLGTAYDVYIEGTSTTNLIVSESQIRNAAIIGEIAEALIKNGVELDQVNQKVIRVKGLIGKDHSVEAITMKSTFRGRHPKRILFDDPCTETSNSEAMRLLIKRKYDEAYKLCSNIVIIGQPVHPFDLYSELRDSLLLLEVPHGTIPELDADLTAMSIAGVDPATIEMSYHLRVPEDGASIFANIKYLDEFPKKETVAFIDPSNGGDYTALSIVTGFMDGVAVYGKAYKKAWHHCIDEMIPVLVAANVKRVAFETNCTGSQPIEMIQQLLKEHGIGVVDVFSTSNKHSTISAAGAYAHLIHLSRESDKVYINQVVKYDETSKHDDAPDSLARCLEWIGLIRGRK